MILIQIPLLLKIPIYRMFINLRDNCVASPFVKGGMRGIYSLTFAKMDYYIVNDELLAKNQLDFHDLQIKIFPNPL